MLTKCLALDGAKAGIRANCVCPGFTETPMIEGYFADQPDPRRGPRLRRLAPSRSAGWARRATSPTRSSTSPPTRPAG